MLMKNPEDKSDPKDWQCGRMWKDPVNGALGVSYSICAQLFANGSLPFTFSPGEKAGMRAPLPFKIIMNHPGTSARKTSPLIPSKFVATLAGIFHHSRFRRVITGLAFPRETGLIVSCLCDSFVYFGFALPASSFKRMSLP
jgi:hypothetical protein